MNNIEIANKSIDVSYEHTRAHNFLIKFTPQRTVYFHIMAFLYSLERRTENRPRRTERYDSHNSEPLDDFQIIKRLSNTTAVSEDNYVYDDLLKTVTFVIGESNNWVL